MTEEIQVPLSIIQGRIKSASWDVVQVTEHPHWLLKVQKCFNLWFFQVAFFFFFPPLFNKLYYHEHSIQGFEIK